MGNPSQVFEKLYLAIYTEQVHNIITELGNEEELLFPQNYLHLFISCIFNKIYRDLCEFINYCLKMI